MDYSHYKLVTINYMSHLHVNITARQQGKHIDPSKHTNQYVILCI